MPSNCALPVVGSGMRSRAGLSLLHFSSSLLLARRKAPLAQPSILSLPRRHAKAWKRQAEALYSLGLFAEAGAAAERGLGVAAEPRLRRKLLLYQVCTILWLRGGVSISVLKSTAG